MNHIQGKPVTAPNLRTILLMAFVVLDWIFASPVLAAGPGGEFGRTGMLVV